MSVFESLQKQHKILLAQQDRGELLEDSDLQDAVEIHIQDTISSSDKVVDLRERDQLRANLRYWSSYIYDQTGKYLNVELRPAPPPRFWPRILGRFAIISLVILSFFALFFYWNSDEDAHIAALETQNAMAAVTNLAITSTIRAMETARAFSSETPSPTSIPNPTSSNTATVTPTVTPTIPPSPETECPTPKQPLVTGALLSIKAEIRTPKNCDTLFPHPANKIEVAGIFSGELDDDMQLWVLVYPHEDQLFYPQAIDACEGVVTIVDQGKGLWRTTSHLGRRMDVNNFDIVVTAVEVQSEVHELFSSWLSDVCERWDIPGIDPIRLRETNGLLRELDTVTISTK